MSSSIADRTDAAVKLVSEFIIEDKVEQSVLWGEWEERSVMAASMSSAVMALLGVVVGVHVEGVWVYPDYHRKSMPILKSMPIFGGTWKSMPILSPKTMPKMPCLARFQGENLGQMSLSTKFGPHFSTKN